MTKQKREMYSSDLSDAQWQYIQKTLNYTKRKRKYSLRQIWNAILYVIKTGCQWRMLPNDFPKWQIVYYYFRKWVDFEEFDLLLEKLRGKIRLKRGQNKESTVGVIDSQSVRWGNNRSLNGIDGNKKVKGIKRHVIVDTNGFLIAVMVTVANIQDGQAAILLMRVLKGFLSNISIILADGGYRGELIDQIKKKFGYFIKISLRKDNSNKTFQPIGKRWVVERTFSWFDNDRRLCRNYELLMETAEEIVKVSAIKHLLNKI
ncbi:MAG TPA: IS5 family transposase [Emticicia sp.]